MIKICNFCKEEIDSWHIGGHALNYHIECFENITILEMIKGYIEKRTNENG